jgi:hypothetical protein
VSYNIDYSRYLEGSLTVPKEDVDRVLYICANRGPECGVEDDLNDDGRLVTLSWYGEGSGRTFDVLVKEVLPLTRGIATILLVWEGGGSITGLQVSDGKVVECDVDFILRQKV